MRISTNQYFANSMTSYSKSFASVTKTQEQISSGSRIQTAADDPVGAAKLLKLQQQSALLDQYNSNITTATNALNNEESILSSITDSLQRARELTLRAGSGGLSDEDRASIASELGQIEETVFSLLNSKDSNGNYIFAGSKSTTQPYVRNADGTYTYQGDQTQLSLQVSDTLSIATNDTGYTLFEQATNVSRTQTTQVSPTTDDGILTLTAGTLTSSRSYNSTYTAGEPYTVTFTSSTEFTVTDALGNDVTSETSTGGLIDPDDEAGTNFTFRGVEYAVNVTLDEDQAADADTLVSQYSFTLSSTPDTITTNRLPSNTSTSQITGGTITDNAAYAAGFPEGGAVIKFTSATDYEVYASPLTDSSKAIGTGTVSGSTITVAGVTLDISGTPATGDKFTVSADSHETQNVLNTINTLKNALNQSTSESGVSLAITNAVASAIGNLDSASAQIDIVRGSIGARGNALDIQSTENSSLGLVNASTQSSIADTDMAAASVQLTLQQTMLQAAQLAFSRISQLSLFDKI
ncbi:MULTISPECIES: flagellar hook-associated protein 3 [Pseudomonas]|uniref:flagellar hook-associated protein 3 n=1 Tax=Pseudomonas TaxID=286 RepID=UPI0021F8BA0B|nr:flagellar hook-associated protein 3 [Pseudomonas putida]